MDDDDDDDDNEFETEDVNTGMKVAIVRNILTTLAHVTI